MTHIAAIVLVLGLCLPQTLLAEVVLEAGEIDSSKVTVGAYAEVIYRTGEQLSTASGYIQAVDAEILTIRQGLGKRIAFEQIQQLILAESSFAMDRLKKTIYILPVKKENKSRRIVGKLVGGVLGGSLSALAGGAVAVKVWGCSELGELCVLDSYLPGAVIGYTIGVPVGVSLFDPHDQFKYSLAGSLIGSAAGLGLIYTKEEFWPALVISPLVGAVIMSEFFRKPPENRRVSIGVLPGPKGRVSAVATLRF